MVLSRGYRVLCRSGTHGSGVALQRRDTGDALVFDGAGGCLSMGASDFGDISAGFARHKDVYGCLGLLPVPLQDTDGFQEGAFYLVVVTECKSVGKLPGCEVYGINGVELVPTRISDSLTTTPPCVSALKKLFATGTFYFSAGDVAQTSAALATGAASSVQSQVLQAGYDLTRRAQNQADGRDPRFCWTQHMWREIEQGGVSCADWLMVAVRGAVEVRTAYVGAQQAKLLLISRLSCERTGARFLTRGVDDEGHAANFAETEQAVFVNGRVTSFILTRGSVPVFWEQPGLQVGSHKVKFSRGFESTEPAFKRHMDQLRDLYGDAVVVSLLGRKEGENALNEAFEKHLGNYNAALRFFHFDVHTNCKGGNRALKLKPLLDNVRDFLAKTKFFSLVDMQVVSKQTGAIRMNCLDCLDRTNFVQAVIANQVLDAQLAVVFKGDAAFNDTKSDNFHECFRVMWDKNGDNLSRCVTGTGAISGGVKTSKLKDATRSITRTIKNNFLDSSIQDAIDILLGKHVEDEKDDFILPDPRMRDTFNQKLGARVDEYATQQAFNIFVGTWNVNGGKRSKSIAYKDCTLSDWLVDPSPEKDMDVYAIGFQEMVDLTASNMVNTDKSNRLEWQQELTKVLCANGVDYIMVKCLQLVGICLYIFVHPNHIHAVKGLSLDTCKTGAGGKVGNKGGVAIRFRFYNSSVCFVCAHLAAGQSHVGERNQDFHDITRRIDFGKGQSISNQEYVFWCGDFNYRIDVPNDECKALIAKEDWETLQKDDQLLNERAKSRVFVGYSEGPVDFKPTYKYDLFSDIYDTSEKARCPAWCDRILFRGASCRLLCYGQVGTLRTSDHRPVLGALQIEIAVVDEAARKQVQEEILTELRAVKSTVQVCPVRASNAVFGELLGLFDECGAVTLLDSDGDRVFITFETVEGAAKALGLDGKVFGGEALRVTEMQASAAPSRSGPTAAVRERAVLVASGEAAKKRHRARTRQAPGSGVAVRFDAPSEELEFRNQLSGQESDSPAVMLPTRPEPARIAPPSAKGPTPVPAPRDRLNGAAGRRQPPPKKAPRRRNSVAGSLVPPQKPPKPGVQASKSSEAVLGPRAPAVPRSRPPPTPTPAKPAKPGSTEAPATNGGPPPKPQKPQKPQKPRKPGQQAPSKATPKPARPAPPKRPQPPGKRPVPQPRSRRGSMSSLSSLEGSASLGSYSLGNSSYGSRESLPSTLRSGAGSVDNLSLSASPKPNCK